MPQNPPTLRGAVAVQAGEAAYVAVATVLSGIDTAVPGRPLQTSSGIALTIIGCCAVAGLLTVAVGLARVRRWSRTPGLLTQLFVGIIGIYVVQSGQLGWGVPLIALSAAGFAALLAPASIRALTNGHPASSGAKPPTG